MTAVTRNPRVYYGWWIIAAALGIMFIHAGTVFYSFGVLSKPLMDEFGWSRGTLSAAQSISMVMGGIGGLVVGKLVERYRIERIITVGAVIGGTCCLLLSLTTSGSQPIRREDGAVPCGGGAMDERARRGARVQGGRDEGRRTVAVPGEVDGRLACRPRAHRSPRRPR